MTSFLTPQRIFLSLMTAFVVFVLGSELFSTLQESQIQDRLELYQTRLVLQASEWQPGGSGAESTAEGAARPQDAEIAQRLRSSVLGENPVGDALHKYQNLTQSLDLSPATPNTDPLRWSREEIDRLHLEQGLLEILAPESNQDIAARVPVAQQQWQSIIESSEASSEGMGQSQQTAQTLQALWHNPPRLLPEAQETLNNNLEGWFRYRSLERLYEIQQRPDAIVDLRQKEQATVRKVLRQLFILTGLPLLGMVLGITALIGLLLQGFWQRWQKRSDVPRPQFTPPPTPPLTPLPPGLCPGQGKPFGRGLF